MDALQHTQPKLAQSATLDRLLIPGSVAEALAVSAAPVRQMARHGLLRSVRIGKCRRIPAADLGRVLVEGVPDMSLWAK
jgi:excisionase family DNA binding protein